VGRGLSHYTWMWLRAFIFTQVVEIPIYLEVLPGKRWKAGLIAFGASAITHPFVWFVFPRLIPGYWASVTVSEIFAVVVEAAYLTVWLKPGRATAASLVANGASFGLGLLSRHLFGAP
jgi:hypothetical protein